MKLKIDLNLNNKLKSADDYTQLRTYTQSEIHDKRATKPLSITSSTSRRLSSITRSISTNAHKYQDTLKHLQEQLI